MSERLPSENNQTPLTRRDLFRMSAGAFGLLAASASTGCNLRVRDCKSVPPNPFLHRGRPLLVAVEGEDLPAMLRAGIEALGGLDKLTTLGRDAIFRGNFVAPQPYPVSTHPDFISTVGTLVRDSGFRRTVLFDSHGTRLLAAVSPDSIMRKLGVIEKLTSRGIEVQTRDFLDSGEFQLVRNPAWSIASPVAVHRMIHEAGVVISLPVVKRHGAAQFTCALKMHFGSVSMADRIVTHKNEGSQYLDQRLVHFADATRPQLTIVDARAILARRGPTLTAGGEVIRGVNRIVLCGDMVATDAYCARLMAERDPTFAVDMIAGQLKHAVELKLGTADLEAVRIVEIRV